MTRPRLHPLLLELESREEPRQLPVTWREHCPRWEGGWPRGCAHLLPLSPASCRRCHRKTNATTAWTGESRDPGRRASDPGPPRYLQPAL